MAEKITVDKIKVRDTAHLRLLGHSSNEVPHITSALTILEQQYIEHKEKFEKWKLDNIKQCGTEMYNQYVEQFNKWEAGVREQQRQLVEERNALSAPVDQDAKLDRLLSQLTPNDFFLAVVMVTSKDPSFFPFLLSCLQKLQAYGEARQASIYQAYASAYAPSASTSYSAQPYVANATTAALGAHPYASVRSDLPVEIGMKRPYERMAAGGNEEVQRKTFRPPSPIRDYRNPSTLPFRDFSQT